MQEPRVWPGGWRIGWGYGGGGGSAGAGGTPLLCISFLGRCGKVDRPHFTDEALREEEPCSGHAIGRKEELGFGLKCIHPLCSSPKVAEGLSHVQAGMIMVTMKRR